MEFYEASPSASRRPCRYAALYQPRLEHLTSQPLSTEGELSHLVPAIPRRSQWPNANEAFSSQPSASRADDERILIGVMRMFSVGMYEPTVLTEVFRAAPGPILFVLRHPGNYYETDPIPGLNVCVAIRERSKEIFPVDKPNILEIQPSLILNELEKMNGLVVLTMRRLGRRIDVTVVGDFEFRWQGVPGGELKILTLYHFLSEIHRPPSLPGPWTPQMEVLDSTHF
ncbi:hypothetical protein F5144DRAFT_569689 [Chaetomium tenue]|uniref:Uncharacterized protein n=1 Tax=Chaetomium tenue TaxID=1854479 RepID=A0ACB7PFL9_9PEZI|nr:hypothetical protein F5144DRAFT_569689 [Chaetomium globosum]